MFSVFDKLFQNYAAKLCRRWSEISRFHLTGALHAVGTLWWYPVDTFWSEILTPNAKSIDHRWLITMLLAWYLVWYERLKIMIADRSSIADGAANRLAWKHSGFYLWWSTVQQGSSNLELLSPDILLARILLVSPLLQSYVIVVYNSHQR